MFCMFCNIVSGDWSWNVTDWNYARWCDDWCTAGRCVETAQQVCTSSDSGLPRSLLRHQTDLVSALLHRPCLCYYSVKCSKNYTQTVVDVVCRLVSAAGYTTQVLHYSLHCLKIMFCNIV